MEPESSSSWTVGTHLALSDYATRQGGRLRRRCLEAGQEYDFALELSLEGWSVVAVEGATTRWVFAPT